VERVMQIIHGVHDVLELLYKANYFQPGYLPLLDKASLHTSHISHLNDPKKDRYRSELHHVTLVLNPNNI